MSGLGSETRRMRWFCSRLHENQQLTWSGRRSRPAGRFLLTPSHAIARTPIRQGAASSNGELEATSPDRVGSCASDVLQARIGVFPGQDESGPASLSRLDQAGRSPQQRGNPRPSASVCSAARGASSHGQLADDARRGFGDDATSGEVPSAADWQRSHRAYSPRLGHRPARLFRFGGSGWTCVGTGGRRLRDRAQGSPQARRAAHLPRTFTF